MLQIIRETNNCFPVFSSAMNASFVKRGPAQGGTSCVSVWWIKIRTQYLTKKTFCNVVVLTLDKYGKDTVKTLFAITTHVKP